MNIVGKRVFRMDCVFCAVYYLLLVPVVAALCLWLYLKITQFWCTSPVNLAGKTALVTGGCSGLGYEISIALAARGCRVIVADKALSESKREKMVEDTHNPDITFEYVDLASFKSVRDFSERIKKTEKKLDILINNAGILGSDATTTEDGLHVVMQVNYHTPFLLTHLLVDVLKKSESGARVIFTTSLLSFLHSMRSPEETKTVDGPGVALYNKSKYLQIVSSDRLAEKLRPYNVTSNCWHPFVVSTGIFRTTRPFIDNLLHNMSVVGLRMISRVAKKPVEGAQTGIYLACADEVKNTTGEFFGEGAPTWKPAYTKDFQEKVWTYTEEAVKLRSEEKL